MNKYEAGDTVEVIDGGETYTTYDKMRPLVGITKPNQKLPREYNHYLVLGYHKHLNCSDIVYGIESSDGKQYMVGEKGLSLIKKNNYHKHHDLIVAWAKGAKVEHKAGSGAWRQASTPQWSKSAHYRIKPSDPNADKIAELETKAQELADELKKLKGEV